MNCIEDKQSLGYPVPHNLTDNLTDIPRIKAQSSIPAKQKPHIPNAENPFFKKCGHIKQFNTRRR